MKNNFKRLITACAISTALTLGTGLLLQPASLMAQTPGGQVCIGGGPTSCYSCPGNPSPGGTGCTGIITSAPAGWQGGFCGLTLQPLTCTSGTVVCGSQINCATKLPQGPNCTTLVICI